MLDLDSAKFSPVMIGLAGSLARARKGDIMRKSKKQIPDSGNGGPEGHAKGRPSGSRPFSASNETRPHQQA
ncbi:MAG: hypothetical protein R3C97_11965 [Geminicoccaceae bacterium]